jgi:hypothetical protein
VGFMAAPPASTTTSLGQRPAAQAKANWPELVGVQVRFRANFAYVEGHLADGEVVPLCRLRYAGSASRWGFALYRASHDDYEDNFFPSGHTARQPRRSTRLRVRPLHHGPHHLAARSITDGLTSVPTSGFGSPGRGA